MKTKSLLTAFLILSAFTASFAQQAADPPPGSSGSPPLIKFDLDFPGGTPAELIAAIQKASGHPLNAIVPEEDAKVRLPAFKMKNVAAPELFNALSAASMRRDPSSSVPGYGFRTMGKISDDSVWFFYVERAPQSIPKICRFYSLARYLESGTTIDDITTAIKTGAEMLGEGPGPTISFHKDTKLLIAVGEPSKLELIDSVLRALDSQGPQRPRPGGGSKPAREEEK